MPARYARVTYFCPDGAVNHAALIDTGSTHSLIPQSLCASINSEFIGRTVTLSTANGVIEAPLVSIEVSINGSPRTKITAIVIPAGVYTLGNDVIDRFRLLG
jgi:predicted aspartyl protease